MRPRPAALWSVTAAPTREDPRMTATHRRTWQRAEGRPAARRLPLDHEARPVALGGAATGRVRGGARLGNYAHVPVAHTAITRPARITAIPISPTESVASNFGAHFSFRHSQSSSPSR